MAATIQLSARVRRGPRAIDAIVGDRGRRRVRPRRSLKVELDSSEPSATWRVGTAEPPTFRPDSDGARRILVSRPVTSPDQARARRTGMRCGCPTSCSVFDDHDRVLGAVVGRKARLRLLSWWDRSVTNRRGSAEIVRLEKLGRYDDAPVVALTLLLVYVDSHGRTVAL